MFWNAGILSVCKVNQSKMIIQEKPRKALELSLFRGFFLYFAFSKLSFKGIVDGLKNAWAHMAIGPGLIVAHGTNLVGKENVC